MCKGGNTDNTFNTADAYLLIIRVTINSMHQRHSNMGRLRTFLLPLSSSPSEEFESSSALDGMVSKSSVSIEGKRRWVHPWGIKRSHESLRGKKNPLHFQKKEGSKGSTTLKRSLENQTSVFHFLSLMITWLRGGPRHSGLGTCCTFIFAVSRKSTSQSIWEKSTLLINIRIRQCGTAQHHT